MKADKTKILKFVKQAGLVKEDGNTLKKTITEITLCGDYVALGFEDGSKMSGWV